MSESNAHPLDYEERLAAVTAALDAAEAAQRYGDVETLRLARQVLLGLIEERAQPL